MQGSIAEEVTEVLKELQQLIRCVLKHRDHLCRHHVVHHKERGLQKKTDSMGHPCPGNCLLDLKATPHNNAFRDPSLGTREGRNMASERLEMEEVALALSVESPDATRLPMASVLRGLLS